MDPGAEKVVVHITLREIYDAVVRLTGRVDVIVEQNQSMRTDLADHESRIRSLERARWPLPSVALLISFGALVLSILSRLS